MNNIELISEKIKKPEIPQNKKPKISVKKKLKALDRFEGEHGRSGATLLERGKLNIEAKKYAVAKKYLLRSLEKDKSLETVHKLSICYGHLGLKDEAGRILEENLEFFKFSGAYWCLIAFYKLEAGDYEYSFMASSKAINEFNQNFPEVWRIFSTASLEVKQHQVAYSTSKKFLDKGSLNEFLVETYINHCLHLDKIEEAIDFLENTDFNWGNCAIIIGIAANLYGILDGNAIRQIKLNEKAYKLNPENIRLKWNLAISQLRAGKLKEGLENYDCRFEWPEFPSPRRVFKKPIWSPSIPKNSKIMLWYEQGIGDQTRFWSALTQFRKNYPNLILEPSPKMQEIIQMAYPEFKCRIGNFNTENLKCHNEDFDYHLPIGTMFGHEVKKQLKNLNNPDFSLEWEFLKSDKLRTSFWKNKLDKMSKKPKIGFCWRSGLIGGQRNKQYTDFNQWKPLLQDNRFSFVNLQYDLSYEEFIEQYPFLEETFLDTGYLDQKDDLDGTLSLISNLDLVISPASAPSMLSSCLGIPTIIYASGDIHWFGRDGKFTQHPIYKNTKCYYAKNPSRDPTLVGDLVSYTNSMLL